ncbi:hypothetical protein [Komagataeibacter oboediens]|uniref:hypothetical protein n=1 Tax=Komagataeibacter oboediens TaxID=65958 RepID=UPI0021ABA51A|nr:hypothetical protein [Komagataeibacter oboediens]
MLSNHTQAVFAFQNCMDPYLFWGMCLSLMFLGMVGLTPLHPHKDLTSHGMIMLVFRRIALASMAAEVTLFIGFAITLQGTLGEENLRARSESF